MTKLSGSCMCGSVQYEIAGDLRDVIGCHCSLCRKSSGHYTAATAVAPENLTLLISSGLKWYRSSGVAQRGFCDDCGSTLFWQPDHQKHISIFAGTLDDQTNLFLTSHICTDEKGDYYTIEEKTVGSVSREPMS
ncbi:MAG: hypothetical protein ACI9JM_003438 [Halioglobus sp.]|jgi:hypothetical protein